jgi:hypothetical protein
MADGKVEKALKNTRNLSISLPVIVIRVNKLGLD